MKRYYWTLPAILLAAPLHGDIIYVDVDVTFSGNGTSWATAIKFLQTALIGAEDADQIWVAEGTYKPTTEANRIRAPITEFCTCTGTGCPDPDRPDRLVIGFLPGDVNQNGTVNPLDLLRFKQIVNMIPPPVANGINSDFVDTDRNGMINPLDLLSFKRLINGIPPSTQSWIGESLPARPCFAD